ncbi:MAG: GyrI-like domain-containing protein [Planctomycetota bacterium]
MSDEPELKEIDGFLAAGLAVRTSNPRECDPATARIGQLWQRFGRERYAESIAPRVRPEELLGIYTDYAGGADDEYTLMVACEVGEEMDIPLEAIGVEVPAGRYLIFRGEGPLPECVIETWARIWRYFGESTQYKRAFAVDFERHDATRPDSVEIAVSIE